MKTKIKLFLISALYSVSYGQGSGEIKGVVMDASTNKTIIGANVWVDYAGNKIGAGTDVDGRYTIKPLNAGTYVVHASLLGKKSIEVPQVIVKADKINFIDTIYLYDTAYVGVEVVVRGERVKLIDPEEPSRKTLDHTQIATIAGGNRNSGTLITLTSDGAFKIGGDGEVYFRGSRKDSYITYLDGVRVLGNTPSIPQAGLKNYTVYTGGMPAKYGDTMGGVVVIETKNYFDLYNQRQAELGIQYND